MTRRKRCFASGRQRVSDGEGSRDAVGVRVRSPTYEEALRTLVDPRHLTRKPGCYLEHVAHGGAVQAGSAVQFRKDLFAFGKLAMQADKRKTA